MEHVAKWAVAAVAVLGLVVAVTDGMTHHDGTDESTGKTLIGVILNLLTLIAVLVWWQPE